MKPPRKTRFARTVAGLGIAVCTLMPMGAGASEGGTGHYLPGAVATLIDLAPTHPGWVIEPIYLRYEGDADLADAIPIAGIDVFGLKATSDVLIVGGFYTFEQPVLGAHYSVGAMAPYVWMTVEGEIGPVLGYILPLGQQNLVAELRWLPELETRNRLEGDYIWLKVVYQF